MFFSCFHVFSNSHVYKHLNGSPGCKHKCSFDCFKIVDTVKTRYCLKLKEAIYINRLKPELNAQLQEREITESHRVLQLVKLSHNLNIFSRARAC